MANVKTPVLPAPSLCPVLPVMVETPDLDALHKVNVWKLRQFARKGLENVA